MIRNSFAYFDFTTSLKRQDIAVALYENIRENEIENISTWQIEYDINLH